ncbi:hypothetical protein LMH73_004785 [Vibrio splendidus]|nr:hypothetical protein [Vibrio splendidus]MCC4882545.1 hypothetical protein [Vibrio splendidus]
MKSQAINTQVRDAYLAACVGKDVFVFLKNDIRLKGKIIKASTDGLVLEAQGKSQQVVCYSALASISPDSYSDAPQLTLDVDALILSTEAKETGIFALQQSYFRSIRNLAKEKGVILYASSYALSGTPMKGEPVVCDDTVQVIKNSFGGLQLILWESVTTTNCELPSNRAK